MGLQAIKVLRQQAAKWGINPVRLGIMGFSAGAVTVLLDVPQHHQRSVGLGQAVDGMFQPLTEFVLLQITSVAQGGGEGERAFVDQGINERSVLRRLRSAVPAGSPRAGLGGAS